MKDEIYKIRLNEIRRKLDYAENLKCIENKDYLAVITQIKAYTLLYNLDCEMIKDLKKQ